MESLWRSSLRLENENQITIKKVNIERLERVIKIPQKPLHTHYCLNGNSNIEDWNFVIFEQCEAHAQ